MLSQDTDDKRNQVLSDDKFKKYKWKKTNFKTPLPKHDPVVIYVTANTKNQK